MKIRGHSWQFVFEKIYPFLGLQKAFKRPQWVFPNRQIIHENSWSFTVIRVKKLRALCPNRIYWK